jgi:hypothetical protein
MPLMLQAQDYRSAVSVGLDIHQIKEYAWCFGLFFLYFPINFFVPKADARATFEQCILQHVEDSEKKWEYFVSLCRHIYAILLCLRLRRL